MTTKMVYVAENPKTYRLDIRYHTDPNCSHYKRADDRFKRTLPALEAEQKYHYRKCVHCTRRRVKEINRG